MATTVQDLPAPAAHQVLAGGSGSEAPCGKGPASYGLQHGDGATAAAGAAEQLGEAITDGHMTANASRRRVAALSPDAAAEMMQQQQAEPTSQAVKKAIWTSEEKDLFVKLVKRARKAATDQHNLDWDSIAVQLTTKSAKDCATYYNKLAQRHERKQQQLLARQQHAPAQTDAAEATERTVDTSMERATAALSQSEMDEEPAPVEAPKKRRHKPGRPPKADRGRSTTRRSEADNGAPRILTERQQIALLLAQTASQRSGSKSSSSSSSGSESDGGESDASSESAAHDHDGDVSMQAAPVRRGRGRPRRQQSQSASTTPPRRAAPKPHSPSPRAASPVSSSPARPVDLSGASTRGREMWMPPESATWEPARLAAWKLIPRNPDQYYMQYLPPGEQPATRNWNMSQFLTAIKLYPPGKTWGLFSMHVPGRTGEQCLAYYKTLVEQGKADGALLKLLIAPAPRRKGRRPVQPVSESEASAAEESSAPVPVPASASKSRKARPVQPADSDAESVGTVTPAAAPTILKTEAPPAPARRKARRTVPDSDSDVSMDGRPAAPTSAKASKKQADEERPAGSTKRVLDFGTPGETKPTTAGDSPQSTPPRRRRAAKPAHVPSTSPASPPVASTPAHPSVSVVGSLPSPAAGLTSVAAASTGPSPLVPTQVSVGVSPQVTGDLSTTEAALQDVEMLAPTVPVARRLESADANELDAEGLRRTEAARAAAAAKRQHAKQVSQKRSQKEARDALAQRRREKYERRHMAAEDELHRQPVVAVAAIAVATDAPPVSPVAAKSVSPMLTTSPTAAVKPASPVLEKPASPVVAKAASPAPVAAAALAPVSPVAIALAPVAKSPSPPAAEPVVEVAAAQPAEECQPAAADTDAEANRNPRKPSASKGTRMLVQLLSSVNYNPDVPLNSMWASDARPRRAVRPEAPETPAAVEGEMGASKRPRSASPLPISIAKARIGKSVSPSPVPRAVTITKAVSEPIDESGDIPMGEGGAAAIPTPTVRPSPLSPIAVAKPVRPKTLVTSSAAPAAVPSAQAKPRPPSTPGGAPEKAPKPARPPRAAPKAPAIDAEYFSKPLYGSWRASTSERAVIAEKQVASRRAALAQGFVLAGDVMGAPAAAYKTFPVQAVTSMSHCFESTRVQRAKAVGLQRYAFHELRANFTMWLQSASRGIQHCRATASTSSRRFI